MKGESWEVGAQCQDVVAPSLHSVGKSQKVVADRRDVVISASLYIMRPLLDAPKTGAV